MKAIISVEELAHVIGTPGVVLIDTTIGNSARKQYEESHIKGAIYVDLENELAEIKDPKEGGRHPLPTIGQFSMVLSNLGISANSRVIVYDRANGANAAARFWWMVRAAGIQHVQVLDGGFTAALHAKNIPLQSGSEKVISTTNYSFSNWQLPRLNMAQIEELTKRPDDALIIDVRDEPRYNGITEPIDLIAGHIPTATNIPFTNNLTVDGRFKSPDELHKLYAPYFEGKNPEKIAVHCGSGVTACHTLLALDYAGFKIPNLYVGSWSEWSRNKL